MLKPEAIISLEKNIGITFRNKGILIQALTHRSAAWQSKTKGNNERLEFLGDAVLELVATEYLFGISDKPEGELTNWRSALVKGEHLAEVAREIKLGNYLIISRGEEAGGGRDKESTLANTVEAVIGAIHYDQGYEKARDFCLRFIMKDLQSLISQGKHRDEKSVFQEKSQEIYNITPHYDVLYEAGPDHDKNFTCGVYINDELIAKGKGASKQKAEQAAAKAGLKKKKWVN